METYRNLTGKSTITGYEIGTHFINVFFADGAAYRYTSGSAGAANIIEMKRLAISGQGLKDFIMSHVRKNYESKLR